MALPLQTIVRRLGKLEKTLLVCTALYVLLSLGWPGSAFSGFVALAAVAVGFVVMFRLARRGMQKLIWRLRNRLIVAYLFIAVVPALLLLALIGITSDVVIGQMAIYLVNSELNRRASGLMGPAESLARTPAASRGEALTRWSLLIHQRFPTFELLVQGEDELRQPPDSNFEPPPPGWKDTSGLVTRNKRVFAWAHVMLNETEVTIIAPVTHEFLSDLVPGLGDVNFLSNHDRGGLDRVPQPANAFDFQITMLQPVSAPPWEKPGGAGDNHLIITTRPSAVLGTVFGQRFQWGERFFAALVALTILLLIVELVSLVTGIKLTQSITGAVHELYEGTQRVKEGDFEHRIKVSGADQLAELGISFNTMTENLARLIVVAKEKERLQSEVEIAREVQSQLFPKNAPRMRGLEITGTCNAARMVSGDYYDFIPLSDTTLGFAIGDVAGKGISAALLMATIQSTMRTQLNGRMPMAAVAAAGGGSTNGFFSTSDVVSQLNRQLYANTSPEKYATFYFGVYDDNTHILTYTNGGHLPPMVVRGSNVEILEVTGTVVGAFPIARYEEKKVLLDVGDLLVAYTDGIVEPENVYGEAYGEDRLQEVLVRFGQTDSGELIARIMENVMQWTGSPELQDDMTVVIARRV